VLRTALRDTALLLGGLTVVGVVVGLLVAGTQGLWGAVVGVALVGFFCATTIVSMMRTVGASPTAMAGVVMGAWVAKIVVLVVVLAIIRGRDFYDPWVLLAVVAVGAIGSALLDYRAVARGRVTYVQP
jgi:chromate transport protein ChrA